MNGKTTIRELKKAAICFKAKANEIIKWLNRDWDVKMPNEEAKWGTPVFQAADNKVTLDLSSLSYVEVVACDEDGNEATYVLLGYKKPNP